MGILLKPRRTPWASWAWKKLFLFSLCEISWGFPGGSVAKNPPDNAGEAGLIPGSGRSLGEGKGNSLQYSCLENSMVRGAWQATVLGVAKTRLSE